ncbi:MAG: transaldolase, partial [Chloroflexota bacterium]
MSKLHDLNELGQSIWYDNISRALLDSGEFQKLLDNGVVGVTSNPSIFEKSIGQSTDYDTAISKADPALSDEAVYENLAIEDIQRTADLLEPIYEATSGLDGYVSLEVSPNLANDTDGTIEAARRLWGRLGRKNAMIKVPATPAGIPAIRQLISDGININVTLLFAIEAYEAVAKAYIEGLEEALAAGKKIDSIASVASFFVSRVDVLVDSLLDDAGNSDLKGKIGLANAKVAYISFQEIFAGDRWEKLAGEGASVQRPLWASTGTKSPDYPDTLYVDQLIGADTVNTVPPKTLDAFVDHGAVANTLVDLEEAQAELQKLAEAGVDMSMVTGQLLDEGVEKFEKAFKSLLTSVADKREKLTMWRRQFSATLPSELKSAINKGAMEIERDKVVGRIWAHDHTVWREDPTEISN